MTASQIVASSGQVASAGVPSALIAAGAVTGPIGAIIGAGIAAVTVAIQAILNSGCGQTCIETSQWANQAEPLLQQNVEAYFAIPAPRPVSAQTQAVNNFMTVWNQLVTLCSQPGLGAAGQNCINDRKAGACKWKATSTGAYPGQPAQGQCWNWWNGYHDPIANDTQVTNDTLTGSGVTSTGATGVVGGTVGGGSDLLVIGGGILAVILLVTLL